MEYAKTDRHRVRDKLSDGSAIV